MNAAQLIEALMDLHPDTEITYTNYDSCSGSDLFTVDNVLPHGELEGV